MTSAIGNGTVAYYQDNSAHGEDTFVIRDLGDTSSLDAVLDGVSRCEGAYASNFTAQLLRDTPIRSVDDAVGALSQANSSLFQSGRGRNLLTTASLALKLGDHLHVINVGDSPVYLVRDGKATELTSIVSSALLLGAMSTAVGLGETFAYEHKSVTLRPGDGLVLATDGLINNVFPEEVAQIVAAAATPQDAVLAIQVLVAEKRRRHQGRNDSYGTFHEDDQTAIFRFLE